MTTGEPPEAGSLVSRRVALVALGATAVAGCTPRSDSSARATGTSSAGAPSGAGPSAGTPSGSTAAGTASTDASPSPASRLDPDVALAALVLREEQAMLDRVQATVRAHPRLSRTLGSARAAHRAHVDLLTQAVPDDQLPSASATGASRVPRRAPAALTALARAETDLAGAHRRHAMAARSGAFARVLASTSAAAQQLSVQLSTAPPPAGARTRR